MTKEEKKILDDVSLKRLCAKKSCPVCDAVRALKAIARS